MSPLKKEGGQSAGFSLKQSAAMRSANAKGTESAGASADHDDTLVKGKKARFKPRRPLPLALRRAIELGLSVIPQDPTTKKPLVGRWSRYCDKPASLRQVQLWNDRWPNAAWAFVTGTEFIVLDFDGPEGLKEMRRWGLQPRVWTPGGGSHVWVKAPPFAVRCDTMHPHVDLKGWHGLATFYGERAEGSYRGNSKAPIYDLSELHEEARAYIESRRSDLSEGDDVPVGAWTAPSDDLIRAKFTEALERATVHGRNTTGHWLAQQLWWNGCDKEVVRERLHEFRRQVPRKAGRSYSVADVEATLRQVLDRESRRSPEAMVPSDVPDADGVLAAVKRELLLVPDQTVDFFDSLTSEDELLDLPDQETVIDGWVFKGGYTIVFGPSGSGKTIVALGMSKGVSRGKRWQLAKCRHGAVLFLEGEGLSQLKARSSAWDEAYPRTGNERGISFTDTPLDITKAESVAQIVRTVRRLEADGAAKVELIVVDPLAEFMTGNENLEGMAAASKSLRVLAKLTDSSVLVLHHTPVDGGRERGYGMLRDKALVSMSVEPVADGIGVVQRKNRHGERRAIRLFFKSQGDSVIVEYEDQEMSADAYDARYGKRRSSSAGDSRRKQRQAHNGQRALNIVTGVARAMAPGERLTQNKLLERCLAAAQSEHEENSTFDKIGRPLLTGQILALSALGEELTVEKVGQRRLYRAAEQPCT